MAIKICSQSDGSGPGGLVQSGEHSPVLVMGQQGMIKRGTAYAGYSDSFADRIQPFTSCIKVVLS